MVVVVIVGGGGWAGLGWTGCRLGCRGWTSPSPSPSPNPTRSITRMPRPCARCARRRRGEEQRIAYAVRVLGTTSYYCTATGQGSGWESECVVSCGQGGKKQMCVPGMAEVFHGRRTVNSEDCGEGTCSTLSGKVGWYLYIRLYNHPMETKWLPSAWWVPIARRRPTSFWVRELCVMRPMMCAGLGCDASTRRAGARAG